MSDDTGAPEVRLRIVRGNPTDTEVAALTALVAAASGAQAGPPPPVSRRGGWGDPGRSLNPGAMHGWAR